MASSRFGALDTVDLGELSNISPPLSESQIHSRQPFRRQDSSLAPEIRYQHASSEDPDAGKNDHNYQARDAPGLGITSRPPDSPTSTRRVPVGSKESINRITSGSTYSSPELHSGNISQATTYQNTPQAGGDNKSIDWTVSEDGQQSSQSFHPYIGSSDREMLAPTYMRGMPAFQAASFECPTHRDILASPWSWLGISILVMAVYSTVFSGIFLAIAMARPRWGVAIGTDGHMSFATATLLSALFSKTIELSFVTVFVAYLGQILTRKAFRKKKWNSGISIAEMSMRTWVMQPGTMVTHWEAVGYAGGTLLGAVVLMAAVVAIFYTTAAEALVSPKLKFGPVQGRVLQGLVSASFANAPYLAQTCTTPISAHMDPTYSGTTCLQIEHAGQGFHNYQTYLDGWAYDVAIGNTSNAQYAGRPPPVANLFDNTTITGQWIPSNVNVTADSMKFGRFVRNITMAMPHAGVFHAVRDPINNILQPEDLQGSGEYVVKASVPAPTLNVLCAGVSELELAALIYQAWPNHNPNYTSSTWLSSPPPGIPAFPAYPNETVFDHLFGFGPAFGKSRQWAPIFFKYPLPYNTIVNTSSFYGNDGLYILATPGSNIINALGQLDYLFCSIKAMQYSNCTTRYHAAGSGGQLSVHCDDDEENTIPYLKCETIAPLEVWEPDWKDVGGQWADALALDNGISDANASVSRMLAQMIPPSLALDPGLPSVGESLGVLGGCTMLVSSQNAPFIHYWNYSDINSALQDPQYQSFNASVTYQDYSSGGTQHWQGIFYLVLLAVFGMDAFCVCFLIWSFHGEGQVTDFTEPQNLFALAMNSPPSSSLSGACGAGPEGGSLGKKWQVDMQRPGSDAARHPHFYMKCTEDERLQQFRQVMGRKSKRSLRSVQDDDVDESPAIDQYMKLSGRYNAVL